MILSEEQKAVVNHCYGKAVVVAGAGSGKTKCLIERCAKLIEDGVPAEAILIFTFTKKAASEITERLINRLGELGAAVTTCTIHSLALKIVREHHEELGYSQKPTIWSSDRITRLCHNSFEENIKSIEPDLETKIKSYTKRKKKFNPEDDPMGFMETILDQDKNNISNQLHSLKLMLSREFGGIDDLDSKSAEESIFVPFDRSFPKTPEMKKEVEEEPQEVKDFYNIIDRQDPEDIRKQVFKMRKKAITEKVKESYRPIPSQISGIELKDVMKHWKQSELYEAKEDGVLRVAYSVLQAKQACSAIEFDDMIPGAIRTLRNDTSNPYRSTFKHVMVDEYQDVNQENVDFIKLLSEKSDSLVVVGDDDQSIYAFRGGNTKHILSFPQEFGAETLYLTTNYRCLPDIVNKANMVVMQNEDRFDKEMVPFRKQTGSDDPVQFITPRTIYGATETQKFRFFDTKADFQREVYQEIYHQINTLVGFMGIKQSEIAVLARNNFQILQFEIQMKRAQIEKNPEDRINFEKMSGGNTFSNATVEIFHNWFNFIINKTDVVSLQEALMKTVKGFGQAASSLLNDAYKVNQEGTLGEWLSVMFDKSRYGEKKPVGIALRRVLKVYNSIMDDIDNMNVYEVFKKVIRISGIDLHVCDKYIDVIEKDLSQNIENNSGKEKNAKKEQSNMFKMYFTLYEYDYAIRRLIGMIQESADPFADYDPEDPFSVEPTEEDIQKARILNESNKKDITEYYGTEGLTKWMDTIKTETEVLEKSEDGISMGTIHSSKGKEWEVVFLIGLTADIIPSPRNIDIDEERRLMYVAMTRAKDTLHVCWEKEMGVSPFVMYFIDESKMNDVFIRPFSVSTKPTPRFASNGR